MTDSTFGGTWASSNTSIATITLTGGVAGGLIAGTVTVSYTVGGCPATATLTVNPLPAAIVGNPSACLGSSTPLTDATPGGTWSSSSPLIAPVSFGSVFGVALGTAIITYTLPTGCIATVMVTVDRVPGSVSGVGNLCVGGTTTLHESTGGGLWSSSDVLVAGVDGTGDVTGLNPGTALISYSIGLCVASETVTIRSLPPAISGSANVCVGATATLTDGITGGTWASSSTAVATIGSTTGEVTGVATGVSVITYMTALGAGCSVTATVTVNPLPTAIVGTQQVCQGYTTDLSDYTGGGTWSSISPLVASVGSLSGVVTGNTGGEAMISYTLSGIGCAATVTVTVYAIPTAFTGDLTVCLGNTSVLGESVTGGTWSSNATSVATIGSATGVVYGASLGTAGIVYTIGTGVAGCTAQATVTVVALPDAYGVTGGGSSCAGGAGVTIGLDSSGGGTNYLLYRGSTATGAFAGTGYPLNFGLQTIAGVYTVVAINTTTGCTKEMRGSATVVITPTVIPAVGITASGHDTICAGTSTTYTANPVNGGTTPGYEWNVNGVNVSTASAYTYIPANGDVIAVTLTSDANCASPVTATHSVTATVQAMETPYVNFSATPGDTVCDGIPVTFHAIPGYGGYAPVYSWIMDGPRSGAARSLPISHRTGIRYHVK